MSGGPITRFRVGADHTHGMWFVRDTLTGRCRGAYGTATEAMYVARRANRVGVLAGRRTGA